MCVWIGKYADYDQNLICSEGGQETSSRQNRSYSSHVFSLIIKFITRKKKYSKN